MKYSWLKPADANYFEVNFGTGDAKTDVEAPKSNA